MGKGKVPKSLQDTMPYALVAERWGWSPKDLDDMDDIDAQKILIWLEHFMKNGYGGHNKGAGIG